MPSASREACSSTRTGSGVGALDSSAGEPSAWACASNCASRASRSGGMAAMAAAGVVLVPMIAVMARRDFALSRDLAHLFVAWLLFTVFAPAAWQASGCQRRRSILVHLVLAAGAAVGLIFPVATHTRRWADELAGSGAMVLDTRKTTPGIRALEKYAVRCGGGTNKRMGLYDVAMIKDNHKLAAGGLTAAYDSIRAAFPHVDIQVEVTTTAEALEAVAAGARFLLCDNMSTDLLRTTVDAVRATGEYVEVEATGGLTLEVAAEYAATGVDYLSVGALTHSSPILDIALDLDPDH